MRRLAESGLPCNARVSDIIEGNEWHFPTVPSGIQSLWDTINFLPDSSILDKACWEPSASGTCTIQSVWEEMRITRAHDKGSKLLWHSWHIPRHSFILWLATKGRLRTQDRLHNQMLPRVPCVLCGVHEEDHNHLFFNCTLSNAVWRMISLKLHVTWPTVPWLQAWEWACDGYASRSQHHSHVLGMALAATIYHLWSERNQRLHHQQHGSVQKLWENICGSVRDRLANLNEVCLLPESIRRQWDIH
ncbi:hypothetical protein OIU85_004667 [Salix viminalis]|uniref:Reverse transcriptase zinc-binding domain-containing protein n=1 Tax=Salix viminalis TaxID=40686 RepID=A0A9Q0PTA5_SALVM|nr:hypothetical protein OIU85_004667 [Salix viminalis]